MIKIKTKLKDYTQKIEQKLKLTKTELIPYELKLASLIDRLDSINSDYINAFDAVITPQLIESINKSFITQLQYKAIESSPIEQYIYNLIGMKYINPSDTVKFGTDHNACFFDIYDIKHGYVDSFLSNRKNISRFSDIHSKLLQFDVDCDKLTQLVYEYDIVENQRSDTYPYVIKLRKQVANLESILKNLEHHQEFSDYEVEIDLDTGDVCKC